MKDKSVSSRHARVAVACAAFGFGMLGMAYAAVPLYELFCRVTGYGGTTQISDTAPLSVSEKTVKVRFDSNIANGLPWNLEAADTVEVRIGEITEVIYTAQNLAARQTTGTATFNVTPLAAGVYFNKMECFCFQHQELAAGEKVEMPVVFFVDPEILNDPDTKDIDTITLSYTMFPVREPVESASVQ
jgi:cytochrome c oxidase assembly protein subunit 11